MSGVRCIVKKWFALLLIAVLMVFPAGCGEEISFEQKYDILHTAEQYGAGVSSEPSDTAFFAESLAVGGNENSVAEGVESGLSEASLLVDLTGSAILSANNVHQRMYPASTTKILTAYVALKYGDLAATTTVSAEALELDEDSSLCGLAAGDVISLEELLYGLMLCSGNDAASVIAEMISGSTEAFAGLMNQEALALGATNSHFVNPHGLPDEQHYTTAYDLYLIFQEAIQNETFLQIIGTETHTASYTDSQGEAVEREWTNSNQYLNGKQQAPEGITVLGGKTGTTSAAGSCLVLLSENAAGKRYISIVMKADGRENLYTLMSELLTSAAAAP